MTTTELSFPSSEGMSPSPIGGYDLYETIGTGAYSTVKRAIKRDTGDVVAVKIIEKRRVDKAWHCQQLRRELELTQSFNHPNICGFMDAMQTARKIYMVFPHASGGDLFSAIVNGGRLSEEHSRRWFSQLASAVHYIHSRGVIHRDIKPENILIDANNNILLSDFGFCALQQLDQRVYALCGSPHTIAPEIITSDNGYCGRAADVWSLGVVLFVMLVGRYPFVSKNIRDLPLNISQNWYTIPPHFPRGAAALLKRMLVLDPKQRANLTEILNDSWLIPYGRLKIIEGLVKKQEEEGEDDDDKIKEVSNNQLIENVSIIKVISNSL